MKYLLGDQCTGSFYYDQNLAKKSLAIDAKTSLLQISGKLQILPETVRLDSSSLTIQYLLTPEGYKILTQGGNFFLLNEPAPFFIKISELSVPTSCPSFLQAIAKSQIKALVENKKASFIKASSQEKIKVADSILTMQKLASEQDFHLTLSTKTQKGADPSGSFQTSLTFNPAPLSAKAHVLAQKVPASILDIVLGEKKDVFSLLLGPSFDANLDFSLEKNAGSFSCDLTSSKAKLHCNAAIQEGKLKLLDTAVASLALTKETSKLLPPSLHSLYAQEPITLHIFPAGFSFPVQPFALDQIQAKNIQLNLGKIYSKNEGGIHSALKALKYKQSGQKDIKIWFAPADIHITNGILDLERTEMLVEVLDLCLWGQINLVQNYADMVFGITASALKQTLGLKNLPDDYVLKLPLQGPLNNVQLKTGSATSKIAALLLWQSDFVKGKLGPLGGLVQKVIPPPGGEGKTPPPKPPFPWQKAS
jgi:hypothetical protein